jgi:PAS domain S-box-containing protein
MSASPERGRGEAVLGAVVFAAERFLDVAAWEDAAQEVLSHLGQAAGAHRVTILRNEVAVDGSMTVNPVAEWCAPGFEKNLERAFVSGRPYEPGYERWISELGAGRVLQGRAEDFPVSERGTFTTFGIRSVAIVPLFCGDQWWGFIGVDDCAEGREWDPDVVDGLVRGAAVIGAAIRRAQREDDMRQAEEKFRTLVEQVPAVIYVDRADRVATSLYLSPQIERLTGTTREEHLSDPELWLREIEPADRERWLTESQRVIERGFGEFSLEYRIRAKDGRVVWVRDHAVLVQSDAGEPLYWRGVIQDITEQKRLEQTLAESEQRYVGVLEASPHGVMIHAEGIIQFANDNVAAMLGAASPAALVGIPLLDMIAPDFRDVVADRMRRQVDTGLPNPRQEQRMLRLDGVEIEVEVACAPLTHQGQPGGIAVIRDLSQRDNTERALREAEAKFRTLVEQLPAIVYMAEFDPAGSWLYVSPRIEQILGYTSEEWASDPNLFDERIHPDDEPAYRAAEAYTRASGLPLSVEYRMRARDGHEVWFQDQAVAVRDASGRSLFHQGIMYDITEGKRAEAALVRGLQREQDAAEELRALEELRNRFLTAVAGELRTPLTAVLGYSLTLARKDMELSSDDREDIAQRLAASARRLEKLLADLLDVDRLARGVLEAALTPINLGDLVRRVVAEIDVGSRAVTVEVDPVVASVDGVKVERILENLLLNVARHTPPDTHVWVGLRQTGEGVLLTVDDDGPGVADESKQEIFRAFEGVANTGALPGTGIGLALVAGFAELHGGRAWVEDRPGGGASFRALLTVAAREEARAAS